MVDISRYFILLLRIRNNFFTLEPQLLGFVAICRSELVVRRSTAETALLGSVGTIRVFLVFQVEADLIEAFFGDKVVFSTKVAAVYDGVDEIPRIRLQIATTLDATDSLEP